MSLVTSVRTKRQNIVPCVTNGCVTTVERITQRESMVHLRRSLNFEDK